MNENFLLELQNIIKKSTLWGSRAWNVNTEYSDYDYAISKEDYEDLINLLKKHEIQYEEYNGVSDGDHRIFNENNLKFDHNRIYNFISFNEDGLIAIDLLNQYMNTLRKDRYFQYEINNKKTRVYLVESFLNLQLMGQDEALRTLRNEPELEHIIELDWI